jgi:hypothetical protein
VKIVHKEIECENYKGNKDVGNGDDNNINEDDGHILQLKGL